MRNILIVLATMLAGLGYGWLLAKHPIAAQIIAGGMGLSFLFIAMVAMYKISQDQNESKH